MDQAYQSYGPDQYANAVFIQSKIEDSLGGKWNVEIFGDALSWGRATYVNADKWILLFSYGDEDWDFIIWAPDC